MALTGKKTFCVVTGASRGIGKAIAVKLAEISAEKSSFLLLATSKERLEAAGQLLQLKNRGCHVETIALDFGTRDLDLSEVEASLKRLLQISRNVERFVIAHNAGTVGDMTLRSYELDNAADWQNHFLVNVTAMIQLNCLLHKHVTGKTRKPPIFINITSLLAIKAFPSFTQYSTSKAAREAYFRAFADEEPNVRVLSYSPGPVLTDMHNKVIETTHDDTVRQLFMDQGIDAPADLRALTPEETVIKMVEYLDKDAYKSGSRIDYYELP